MEILHKGIFILVCISCVYGQCDIVNCNVNTNTLFQACSEYTKTMNCMKDQYDKCVGTAGQTEITLSMQAMHTPSDCAFNMHGMANSMTAQSNMYASMMKKAPQGLSPLTFPLGNPFVSPAATGTGTGTGSNPLTPGLMPPLGMLPMMGDEMEMEGMEMGEGPMEMMEDMMEDGRMLMPGMAGMMMPGLFGGLGGLGGEGGAAGGEGLGGLPGGLMTSGKGKGGGAARFVDYRNDASGVTSMSAQTIVLSLLAILLSLL